MLGADAYNRTALEETVRKLRNVRSAAAKAKVEAARKAIAVLDEKAGQAPNQGGKFHGAVADEETTDTRWRSAVTPEEAYADAVKKPGANERTYSRAPNGRRSNLSNALYHLVRTKQFKDWYGDWEAYAKKKAIEAISPVEVKPLASDSDEDVIEIYKKIGEAENVDGRKVRFVNSVIGKILRHKGYDTRNIVPYLKDIFHDAVYLGFEEDRGERPRGDGTMHKGHRNFVGYHNYLGSFRDSSGQYYVRFTVQELKTRSKTFNPNELHSTFISDIEVYKNSDLLALSTSKDEGKVGAVGVDSIVAKYLFDFNRVSKRMFLDENGEPLVLYHGSNRFGTTVFDKRGMLFTTSSESRANGYGGVGSGVYRGYSRTRDIEKGHPFEFEGNNWTGKTEDIVKKARSVLGAEVHKADANERVSIFDKLLDQIRAYNERVNSIAETPTTDNESEWDFYNDVSSIMYAFGMDEEDFNSIRDAIRSGDAESIFVKQLDRDLDNVHDRYNALKNKYFDELRSGMDEKSRKFYDEFFKGYTNGDFLISMEGSLKNLLNPENDVVSDYDSSVLDRQKLLDSIVENNDHGTYRFFVDAGENPLVVDANGAHWTDIKFNGKTMSTDAIAEWAKENGYTSVHIKNVMDPGIDNARGDDFITFKPEQVKSADLATYDDNGNLIPLSQRFDQEKVDIRWRTSYTPHAAAQALADATGIRNAYERARFLVSAHAVSQACARALSRG